MFMHLRKLLICASVLVVALHSQHITAQPENPEKSTSRFYFAVLGDQPYNDADESNTAAVLADIHSNGYSTFALHLGDLKGGGERCDDALLERRLNLLKSSRTPLIYTPGDNDWVDCHRASNGNFDPFERLDFLRKQAFSDDFSFGDDPFLAKSQRKVGLPENRSWVLGATLFLTLNIQGSNNNGTARTGEIATDNTRELDSKLQKANVDWLIEQAKLVASTNISQWVVVFQGNPIDGSGQSLGTKLFESDGFRPIMQELAERANQINKPLLLIHGDTHLFKFDQPSLKRYGMTESMNKKFWRLEGWGHPFVRRWVKVEIQDGSQAPFYAESIPLP